MFHLFTHAFFKALLFLGAGSVIHAMHHEQDMRFYGALRKEIPLTFWAMLIGTLAITGVGIIQIAGLPSLGFAGFFSKDAIIESAYASGSAYGGFAYFIGVFAALLTSFYSWRLIFLTFYGKPRWAASEHVQHVLHGDHDDHPDAESAGHDTHSTRRAPSKSTSARRLSPARKPVDDARAPRLAFAWRGRRRHGLPTAPSWTRRRARASGRAASPSTSI
jgi:NADH-quinone oxidoreductase subunit L